MSATRIKHKDTCEGQEPMKFDNMFGELEFYKKRCEVLEKDLIKSQNTIKKMDVSLKKLQEINTINAKSLNNTSIPFFLTSEFKNNWENFAKDQIMEAFENTFDDYFWLAHIVQDTVYIIYQETNNVIFQKISSILKVLNIDEKYPEKFLSRFRTFFQEYFVSIFAFSDEIMNRIKIKLYEIIGKYKNFEEKIIEGIKKDIESKPFRNLSQMIFKLCIYMLLHEPQLTLNIQPYEKREFSYNYYSKTEHLNIEGFGNDQSSCITILAPPMIRNYLPFQGIKPSVYIIPQPNEEIIKCCEKNKAAKKIPQAEKTDITTNNNNINNEKSEKVSSPMKTERKCKEVNDSEAINNLNNFSLNPPNDKQSNHKLSKAHPSNSKDQTNPTHNSVKEKIPTNYMKFNKNIGKDIIISESNTKY